MRHNTCCMANGADARNHVAAHTAWLVLAARSSFRSTRTIPAPGSYTSRNHKPKNKDGGRLLDQDQRHAVHAQHRVQASLTYGRCRWASRDVPTGTATQANPRNRRSQDHRARPPLHRKKKTRLPSQTSSETTKSIRPHIKQPALPIVAPSSYQWPPQWALTMILVQTVNTRRLVLL